MLKLVIVQPYVPSYRVAFFEKLISSLAHYGIDCRIAAAEPDSDQSKRGDASTPSWVIPVRQRRLRIGGRTLSLGGSRKAWSDADAVIVGLVGSSLDAYQALLYRKLGKLRVGVWGHVKPYVSIGNALDLWLEKQQMKLADQIFAYTPGGKQYAQSRGISAAKITTVMNAVDTTALQTALRSISPEDVRSFASNHRIDPRKTLAFLGGLDSSKRIEFLARALDEVWHVDKSIRVIVGGLGPDVVFLEPAIAREQVIILGYADARQKALISRNARAIVMPGRIGLVAVDALVLGLPIITTDWAFHAPEAEYLSEGSTRITSKDSPEAFASTVLRFIARGDAGPTDGTDYPSIEDMVSNFTAGILAMLQNEK